MSGHIDWDRLARYVANESAAAEAAEVERWAAEDSANRRLLESVNRRWVVARSSESFDVDRAWKDLSARMTGEAVQGGVVPIGGGRRSMRWTALPIAAALLLAIGVYGVTRTLRPGVPASSPTMASMDVRTGVGERRTVQLPDGSEAVLGARSTLRMEASEGRQRQVHLEGEAIFSVRHDPEHPFRVEAGGVLAEDVGTEFSVRAYANEPRVRIAVREGAVSVTHRATPQAPAVLLAKQDVARIDGDGMAAVTSGVAVDRLFAWRDGELVFDNVPLSDVAVELSRWYDVDMRFADSTLATRHLTASFHNEPIEEVLRVIGLTLEIRFQQQGRVYVGHPAPRTSLRDPIRPRSLDVAARGGV
ncbi:MAG: FecR domain-containing protein [Gemmatimonadaceae bacterium]